MTDTPAELAITDAVSNFSLANHQSQDGRPRSPRPGTRLNRGIVSRLDKSKDITSDFRKAAEHLPTGELIKDDFFSLFDAVGALEVMDPKMDSGYLEPGESLEDDYDISCQILPDELISILDGLLGLQVAWMTGYPLSQTVLSSVYVENILWPEPKTLDQATFRRQDGTRVTLSPCQSLLRIYCMLMLKTCDFIFRRISGETFYEEEDFFTQLYNRSLLTAFPSDHIFALAEEVINDAYPDESISPEYWPAISSRLNVQLTFCKVTKQAIELDTEDVSLQWKEISLLLPTIENTHHQGKPLMNVISSKIQRRLASSVPPRPVVELGLTQTIDFMSRLCKDGMLVENVSKCRDLESTLLFISFFQAQYPQPTVYLRCQLQRLIVSKFQYLATPDAVLLAQDDILSELQRLVNPVEALTNWTDVNGSSSSEIVIRMQRFIGLIVEPFWNYIRAITMNRSRTRRMLCHTANDWDAVQMELEDLDIELRQYTKEKALKDDFEEMWEFPLSSWAYDMKLRQLVLIHQLGFELEIYHRDELSTAYNTLQWICSARMRHLDRIKAFVQQRASLLAAPTEAQADAYNITILTLDHHIDSTIAIAALAGALSLLYQALVLLDLLPEPPIAPYSTDSMRRALRVRPFAHILHPALPSAEESEVIRTAFMKELLLKARSKPRKPSTENLSPRVEQALAILDHVDEMTKSARKAWEIVSKTSIEIARAEACETAWRADIKNIQKSAIAVGLVSMGVRKWVENGGAEKGTLEVDVSMGHEAGLYHVFWVVPKIKSV